LRRLANGHHVRCYRDRASAVASINAGVGATARYFCDLHQRHIRAGAGADQQVLDVELLSSIRLRQPHHHLHFVSAALLP
jgi:hypothetical protein